MNFFSLLVPSFLAFSALAHPASLVPRAPSNSAVLVTDGWRYISDQYAAKRPNPTYKINRWTNTIPDTCYAEAVTKPLANNWAGRCTNIANLRVFEVTYSDASKPWLFCQCTDTGVTEASLIENVGKIPPGIRQHSRYIMNFKGDGSAAGTVTWEGDIIIYGNPLLKTYLHEMAHQIDIRSINDGLSPMYSFEFSSRAEYSNANNKADCWASYYARDSFASSASYVEGWAEVFLFTTMTAELSGSSAAIPNYKCLVPTMATQMSQTWEMTLAYSTAKHLPYGATTIKRDNLPSARMAVTSSKAVSEKEDPDYAIID